MKRLSELFERLARRASPQKQVDHGKLISSQLSQDQDVDSCLKAAAKIQAAQVHRRALDLVYRAASSVTPGTDKAEQVSVLFIKCMTGLCPKERRLEAQAIANSGHPVLSSAAREIISGIHTSSKNALQ